MKGLSKDNGRIMEERWKNNGRAMKRQWKDNEWIMNE